MVGTGGMKISVGDASVQIVTMPGHTPGTLGGTAIPFNENAAYYDGYIASSAKMAKAASAYGATALLSSHSEFDDAFFKAHTAASRQAGEAHPFDAGADGVTRYFNVVQYCAEAAKLRTTGQ